MQVGLNIGSATTSPFRPTHCINIDTNNILFVKKFLIALMIIVSTIVIYYFIPEENLPVVIRVDKIVIVNSERIMQVYSKGSVLKPYKISLGRNPVGD